MLEAVLANEHLNVASRPTLEELTAADDPISPALFKMLGSPATTFPNLAHNLEGMALFSSTELRLVSDNDCGMLGATTQFWRVRLIIPDCVEEVGVGPGDELQLSWAVQG